MNNTLTISLPVADAVVKNITSDFETRFLNMLLNTLHDLNVPGQRQNLLLIILILCIAFVSLLLLVIHNRCRRCRTTA